MSWKTLLDSRRVRTHVTSQQELNDLRALIARDLKDAAVSDLSADRRFATAYNAALQLAKMAIACAGYRVIGAGHHRTTFEALPMAMGPEERETARYLDVCRRKRNIIDYDLASTASEREADELVAEARALLERVEEWIDEHHAGLA